MASKQDIWLAPENKEPKPDATYHIKLIEAQKSAPQFSVRLRWLMLISIFLAMLFMILWGTYVYPQMYPPSIHSAPVSIMLTFPTYVSIGDEAELDITVTNVSTRTITGTVTVLFEGNAGAIPRPQQLTSVHFEDLAGGTSITQQVGFSIRQPPRFFCRDMVNLALQITIGNQSVRLPTQSQIAMTPIPYLNKVISWLSGSAILTTVFSFFWEEIKRRFLGIGGE